MKKFLKNTFIFILIIIIITASFIFVTNKFFNNDKNFTISKNVKYLIIGHSHSQNAFNDSLIKNTKNFSQSADAYFYVYVKMKKLCAVNKNIKTVFVEFTNNQISSDMEKWVRGEYYISYKLPKYSAILEWNDFEYLAKKNPEAIFKSVPTIFKNNLQTLFYSKKNYLTKKEWGGYFYTKKCKTDSLLQSQKNQKGILDVQDKFTDINLEYLSKIVDYCTTNNIKIYLVRSPQHKDYTGFSNELKLQQILKNKYEKIPFLDFNNLPLENSDYEDLQHTNYKGANKFSLFFNHLLEKGLLDKSNKQEFIDIEMKKLALIK